MNKKLQASVYLTLLFSLANVTLSAQEIGFEWLPSGSYFGALLLDPSTPLTSASLLIYQVEGSTDERIYSPINIGVQKMVGRYVVNRELGFELGLEFGLHSQFTIVDVGEAYMGGLQNTDFRIGAIFHYKMTHSVYRVTLFHQSSHLGDDYMLRNEYFIPNSKVLNYEQLDLTHSIQKGYSRYYYGLGYNISPNTTRKRSAFQCGYFYTRPFHTNTNYAYLYGVDIKVYEQNDYQPNFKAGIGIELARSSKNPFMIILEYYNGHLPYSTLEYQVVQLYGLGVYFHLR